MEVTSLCIILLVNVLFLLHARAQINSYYVKKADAAFLRIEPNRLQFFEYESISFNCGGSSEWRVMKKLSSNTSQWNTSTGSLNLDPAFVSHSGEYFCENGEGERGNAVNISVTAGDVILESPALPVMEQQTVTLRCRKKATADNSPADFFKDGKSFKTAYTGSMIIPNVSSSSEGLYKCSIPGAGSSSASRLAVRAYVASAPQETTPKENQESSPHPPDPGSIQLSILLPVVLASLCLAVLLLVVGLLLCRKNRACFSTERPTTGPDPVYEHVSMAEPQIATYANMTKHRKQRERASGEANAAEATYAVVSKQRKERDMDRSLMSSDCYSLSTGPGVSNPSALPVLSAHLYHSVD